MNERLEHEICMHTISVFIDKKIRPAMQEAGIKKSYGPFLMSVLQSPGCSLKDIASQLHTDKALVTRIASELLEKGYIENMSANPRLYSLRITSKGEEAVQLISDEVSKAWDVLLRDLTAEERENGRRMLEKIQKVSEEELGGE